MWCPIASDTLRAWISLPSLYSRPEMLRPYERPKTLIASSVRPAPMRPAMPTTSPARTLKDAPSTTLRPGWVGWKTVQSSTRSTSSPTTDARSGYRCSRSRPTMPRMIRSWVDVGSDMSMVSMVRPSRMIVVRSAISAISLSLCEMMIDVMPCPLRWRSRSSRCSESVSLSAAVGSSRMSSRTSFESALAISMSCCLPTPRVPTGVSGFSSSPTRASSFAASAFDWFQSISPARPRRSLPRKMFSATDRYGTRASSWWMMTTPRASESLIEPNSAAEPSKTISPS